MNTTEAVGRFPVVMLYDHFSSVGVAMATYTYLIRELENDFKPELRVWRMDVATSPDFAAEANADIAAAEVIIMTVRANQPWPVAFRPWRVGGQGVGDSPHAIIVILDATDKEAHTTSGSWDSALRSAATQIHPEVFFYETKPDPEPLVSFPVGQGEVAAADFDAEIPVGPGGGTFDPFGGHDQSR